jgi:hypothetical protein
MWFRAGVRRLVRTRSFFFDPTPSFVIVVAALCLAMPVAHAFAAPVLRSADIRIIITSPTSCEVAMTLSVDGTSDVDHWIQAFGGSRIDLLAVAGAQQISGVRVQGRTQSLLLRPAGTAYALQYRVAVNDTRAYRCPMWVPAVPTDGRSRAIRMQVDLPAASSPSGGSMPAFAWTGAQGSTTLAHIPSFVHVRYATAGEAPGWDITRVMDSVAVGVFVLASAVWIWRRRR